ncbi:MAG: 50S ribosomal protein L1 [Candidatus Woesearchaeota archaeon]|nr:MAG: 50S ribosomal protein L1 [Candidatus Woesearchaeota archaeon]
MDKKQALEVVTQLRQSSPKRNFIQAVDLIVNLQDLDFKKPDHQIDFYVVLPHGTGKKKRIAAFVDVDMIDEAKSVCDTVISLTQFDDYAKDKKKIKKLAKNHDYFIAQSTIMSKIASTFGRILGPRNKMPNPKAGCVVASKSNIKPVYDRLQKTIRVLARNKPLVQLCIAREDMSDEQIADNLYFVYDQLIHHLPKEKNNIKSIFIKTTMGKAVKVEV